MIYDKEALERLKNMTPQQKAKKRHDDERARRNQLNSEKVRCSRCGKMKSKGNFRMERMMCLPCLKSAKRNAR